MPLAQGSSNATREENIKREIAAGKSPEQAAAIAYSVQRKAEGHDEAPAAGILCIAGDSVLMLCRPDGTWGFPGGSIEDGESAETAAMRELYEETGYEIGVPLRCIGTYENFVAHVAIVPENFPVTLNDEHTAYEWRDIDSLPSPLHRDGLTRQMLSAAFNAGGMDRSESAKEFDINGWFEVFDNPLSLVGVFDYLGKNIPQEVKKGNAGKMFKVYRPAEELQDPACQNSFRLMPWVITHSMLGNGTGGTKTVEEKQMRGVIGERLRFDPNLGDHGGLRGNIKCFSDVLAKQIAGGRKELSLGYRCIYEYAPGVFDGIPYTYVQRMIRGNHVATVDDGRMGEVVAVMDESPFTFTVDAKEFVAMAKKTPNAKKSNVVAIARSRLMSFTQDAEDKIAKGEDSGGDIAAAVKAIKDALPLLESLEALKAVGAAESLEMPVVDNDDDVQPGPNGDPSALSVAKDNDDDPEKDKKGEGMDAAEFDRRIAAGVAGALKRLGIDAAKLQPVATGMDAKDVIADIGRRDKLAARLSDFVGTFDHSEMTTADVGKYGVEKLGIPNVAAGSEVSAVEAFLHNRKSQREQPTATGMDAKDRKPAAWLDDQLKAQKA